ncbi:MAG: 50S ribosomal protein L24 [Candidatus Bathyarchaeia archaeon]
MQTVKAVTKPTKQRKRLFQAPDHIRYKLFAAPLSPELRKSHGVKTIPVRSGDTVRIMRGDHKGFEGKITKVDREKYRIYVEGLTREKVDGTTTFVPIHPSKVMITRLNLDDKWRKKILARKKEARKKIEEAAAKKVPEKIEEVKEEVIEEKVVEEEKPKRRRRRQKAPRKSVKKAEEFKEEEKPKTRKRRAKRKTATKKTEGGK